NSSEVQGACGQFFLVVPCLELAMRQIGDLVHLVEKSQEDALLSPQTGTRNAGPESRVAAEDVAAEPQVSVVVLDDQAVTLLGIDAGDDPPGLAADDDQANSAAEEARDGPDVSTLLEVPDCDDFGE
ncbi:unnamed protein product, partial [Polarella glacialis]